MPRDGLSQYAPPPGTNGITNYTIESTKYNGFVADVTQDLNLPRPIVAGGTGANNAIQARDNLDAEVAQQTVTNYDTQVWENGSFWSAPGAIGAPDNPTGASAYFYAGICYKISEAAMFLEARREASTGTVPPKWVKAKWSSWGPWSKQVTSMTAGAAEGISGTAADMFFGTTTAPSASFIVNTESDVTGTNALTVRKDGVTAVRAVNGDAVFELAALPGRTAQLTGSKNGAARWNMRMGDATAETGGNVGSDFWLYGVDDSNTVVSASGIQINRKTGNITLGGNTTVSGNLTANGYVSTLADLTVQRGGAPTTGYVFFGNSGSKYLGYDGANFNLGSGTLSIDGGLNTTTNVNVGGLLYVSGPITAQQSPTVGSYYFGISGTKYLNFDGVKFNFSGGNLYVGTPHGSVDAPIAAGTAVSGIWPVGISGTDRGILFLAGSASNIYQYFCQGTTGNAVGSINGSTTGTNYNTASSGELKEDLKSFDAGNIIDQTKVYDFAWKSTGERSYGVIAQQAIDVYPLAVTHVEKVSDEIGEFWGVDYSKYVPVLLQELKALRARVAQLEGGSVVGKPA